MTHHQRTLAVSSLSLIVQVCGTRRAAHTRVSGYPRKWGYHRNTHVVERFVASRSENDRVNTSLSSSNIDGDGECCGCIDTGFGFDNYVSSLSYWMNGALLDQWAFLKSAITENKDVYHGLRRGMGRPQYPTVTVYLTEQVLF